MWGCVVYKLKSCASCNFIPIHLLRFVGVYVAVSGGKGVPILMTSCRLISSLDLLGHAPPTWKTGCEGQGLVHHFCSLQSNLRWCRFGLLTCYGSKFSLACHTLDPTNLGCFTLYSRSWIFEAEIYLVCLCLKEDIVWESEYALQTPCL